MGAPLPVEVPSETNADPKLIPNYLSHPEFFYVKSTTPLVEPAPPTTLGTINRNIHPNLKIGKAGNGTLSPGQSVVNFGVPQFTTYLSNMTIKIVTSRVALVFNGCLCFILFFIYF